MIDKTKVLNHLPISLRDPLIDSYNEIISNYSEHRWEPSELNGGKFCEVVYTILDGYIKGNYPMKPSKPKNIVIACETLGKVPADQNRVGDKSVRILIPKMLLPLYEIRNNRGVGHSGGDVNPNFLDATAVYSMASWILSELIRIFHNVSTKEAQEIVDVLIERPMLLVWEVEGMKRVLAPNMSAKDKVLILLHSKPSWVDTASLFSWVKYSNLSVFKKKVLEPLDSDVQIEYDTKNNRVRISPLGSSYVERNIINKK